MNIKELDNVNQLMLDKLSVAHGNVMEHCLDYDREEQNSAYNAHALVREVIGREVYASSIMCNEARAAVHTVRIPPIEIHRRKRENQRRADAQMRLNARVAVASTLKELI